MTYLLHPSSICSFLVALFSSKMQESQLPLRLEQLSVMNSTSEALHHFWNNSKYSFVLQKPHFHWLGWEWGGSPNACFHCPKRAAGPPFGGAEPLPSRSAYEVDPERCTLPDRLGGSRGEVHLALIGWAVKSILHEK